METMGMVEIVVVSIITMDIAMNNITIMDKTTTMTSRTNTTKSNRLCVIFSIVGKMDTTSTTTIQEDRDLCPSNKCSNSLLFQIVKMI
jgi:hypothetical protein